MKMAKFSFIDTGKIDGEQTYAGTYKNKSYRVIFIPTEVDYGWQPISYLPQFTEDDAGIAVDYCYEIGQKIEQSKGKDNDTN